MYEKSCSINYYLPLYQNALRLAIAIEIQLS